MRRPRPAIVVLIGSLALLIGAPLAWAGIVASDEPPAVASVGDRPEDVQQSSPATAATEVVEVVGPDVAGADVPRIGRSVQAPDVRESLPPVQITIERLGIEAPVDAVGILSDGGVEIPDDVDRVGWYQFGSDPGQQTGSTVIVGHRDGVQQGRGAFYAIGSMNVGDMVDLQLADGTSRSYSVVAREVIAKEVLPTSELFDEDGAERVTLISCIGYFDRSNGGYRENVVVTAVPVDDSAMGLGS